MNYQSFFSRAASGMQESAIRKMGMLGSRGSDLISFAPGYPDPASFPWDEFAAIAADGFKAREASALQYGPTRGYGPLVEAIGGVMAARHIPSKTDETLVTTGSQQGLDLIGRVLIDPGDVILVELPTYTGAITAFTNVQAQLVGVRQGSDGIDLDDLDAVIAGLRAAGRRIRFLYVVPNFQNPTGLLIGREKRLALLAAAARHDFLQGASYLVLGAAAAALLRVALPPWVFQHLAGHLVLGVLTMALLAVVLALCSEADAFVAASLTMLPLLPRLVFLVVGPAVDVKLSAMQAGMFGRPFAIRFGPATFVVATVVATIVGLVVLR